MDDSVPSTGFHFGLRIAGRLSHGVFQEVSGLDAEMEPESVTEGGESHFVHRLPKTLKNGCLTLKRGLVAGDSELVQWCQEVLERELVAAIKTQQIELDLLIAESQPIRSWTFDQAYPLKWSVMEVHPETNTLLLETIDLAYATVRRKL